MRTKEHFPTDACRQFLDSKNLKSFTDIWSLDAGWFEEPNKRRGGWSGVSRYEASGDALFIKRQENHFFRPWYKLFFRTSTFIREFKNLVRFRKLGIPTLELIYFGQRQQQKKLQAIIITKELRGYLPLDNEALQANIKSNPPLRKIIIGRIAEVVRGMHDHHLQHNCLYPKHIFIRLDSANGPDVRLIDLEKVKWRPFKKHAMLRDLDTLQRHATGWSKSDQIRFFLSYRAEHRLSNESKNIARTLSRRTQKINTPRKPN